MVAISVIDVVGLRTAITANALCEGLTGANTQSDQCYPCVESRLLVLSPALVADGSKMGLDNDE